MDQKPTRNKVVISDFKDKKEKTLYEIINEVLTTEEGYIRDLAVLIGVCNSIFYRVYFLILK